MDTSNPKAYVFSFWKDGEFISLNCTESTIYSCADSIEDLLKYGVKRWIDSLSGGYQSGATWIQRAKILKDIKVKDNLDNFHDVDLFLYAIECIKNRMFKIKIGNCGIEFIKEGHFSKNAIIFQLLYVNAADKKIIRKFCNHQGLKLIEHIPGEATMIIFNSQSEYYLFLLSFDQHLLAKGKIYNLFEIQYDIDKIIAFNIGIDIGVKWHDKIIGRYL